MLQWAGQEVEVRSRSSERAHASRERPQHRRRPLPLSGMPSVSSDVQQECWWCDVLPVHVVKDGKRDGVGGWPCLTSPVLHPHRHVRAHFTKRSVRLEHSSSRTPSLSSSLHRHPTACFGLHCCLKHSRANPVPAHLSTEALPQTCDLLTRLHVRVDVQVKWGFHQVKQRKEVETDE